MKNSDIISGPCHSFDSHVAINLGLNAAILLNHIKTLNTLNISKAFLISIVDGYMSEKEVEDSIQILISKKLIKCSQGRIFETQEGE